MKRSGQLVYGQEFELNVFQIQSGIRYTIAFAFTVSRVTGVTLHAHFCCARLNTSSAFQHFCDDVSTAVDIRFPYPLCNLINQT